MDKCQAMLASGKAGEVEARLRRFDGNFRWFLFRGSPQRDQSGRVVKWHGTNTDLEYRKHDKEALHASERDLRLIIDSIPGFVWTNADAGEIELISQPYLNYL